jgi:SMC interacting uncharacterized protein involved in chromosome segregation
MSPADVDRINGLNRQLDRDLQHMGQRKDKVEQEAWKLEMAVSKMLQGLEGQSLECNNVLDQLDVSHHATTYHPTHHHSSTLVALDSSGGDQGR